MTKTKKAPNRFPLETLETVQRGDTLFVLLPIGPARHETLAGQFLAVCRLVSEEYGFSLGEILGHDKPSPLSWARQVAYFLCRWSTDASFPSIAAFFGRSDHTAILYGWRKVQEQQTLATNEWARVEKIMRGMLG